ncbi:MAG: RecQ family ATP-dependent DNA helicase, partial [bacterium]|nr:RecQ family ATP-dependent DNA helicase [bacterium]
ALTPDKQSSDGLAVRLGTEFDAFQKAIEKLWIHGGALVDPEENAAVGHGEWKKPYVAQRDHRLLQLEQITRFAQARDCRMLHMVRHFGDQEDSGEPCGGCDVCAPDGCLARSFRAPTPEERETMRRIFAVLREWNNQGTGQLFQRSSGGGAGERRSFERVLSGLVRAELVQTREDSFRKDGRTIHFQRASLTPAGYRVDDEALERVMVTVEPKKAKKKAKRAKKKKVAAPRKAAKRKTTAPRKAAVRRGQAVEAEAVVEHKAPRPAAAPQAEAPSELFEALREWRLGVARKKRIPAFRILTDRTLTAIASARPGDEEGLLAVSGVGPASVRKYGEAILEIVAAGDRRQG